MEKNIHKNKTVVEKNKIYADIYRKRIDNRVVSFQADLQCASIDKGTLIFESLSSRNQAFLDGVFLLKIPSHIDIATGDDFSNNFYRGKQSKPYGHFRDIVADQFDDKLLGFHQRVNQIEQFLLERRFWKTHYPYEITELAEQLTRLSKIIICSALEYSDIPKNNWSQVTGSCAEENGAYHLTFNHYRPNVAETGLNSHKDDGFLTILRTTLPGLEVNRRDRWEKVSVDSSYFVINFGLSMEILTSKCTHPISAIMHRVAHQDCDRTSFGHFSSSNFVQEKDQGVYRYIPEKGVERICNSRELIDLNDHEIYEGTERPKEKPYEY